MQACSTHPLLGCAAQGRVLLLIQPLLEAGVVPAPLPLKWSKQCNAQKLAAIQMIQVK